MSALVPEFREWQSIARLNRSAIITEKIDGTNGVVYVGEDGTVLAGSRSRWLTMATVDNFGFAKWVAEHEDELRDGLGPGYHYGEWWGSGIQRGYGLTGGERRFSLFNTHRWGDDAKRPACCGVVPVLRITASNLSAAVDDALWLLRAQGSMAASGFMRPEGVVIYHTASKALFKVTLEKDEMPKSLVAS